VIKLKDILSEGLSKNKVQAIVDKVFPQIVQDRGEGKQGVPKIKLHHDIYARLSGIEDMRGEESDSTKAQWVDEHNTIFIYYTNMKNEEDVIRSVLHEFEHTHQDTKKNEKYREQGYDNNPYEIAARNAEKNWKQYATIDEIDYHSKLSRGHKPDWYQLGTSEFKPFDENAVTNHDGKAAPYGSGYDEVEENFADGKKPGRKGISKRVGIPKGATLTQLAKLAKAKGEKGRMARWQLNMRRGRKKKR